jgi:manganese/zinc/iron transport system permease protein
MIDILLLQGGYNTSLVMIGAGLLGAAGGAAGSFTLLRRRGLVSDAMSHATLPGIALAFLIGHATIGDGRAFWLLMAGAALAAFAGLLVVDLIRSRTRLSEDAAIGIVLSTFFGAGIVLLTVVQALNLPGQAGLSGYLLGSTASMLRSEAIAIALAALGVALAVFALRNVFAAIAFDENHARTRGLDIALYELLLLGLVLLVVVIGLKAAGIVLVIALLIIPPVTARLWTDRVFTMVWLAAAIGAGGAYLGAAFSASAPDLPTGAIIVLTQFALFALSLLVSPKRGALATALSRARLGRIVHARQGLLALARGEPIFDPVTLRLLTSRGFLRKDGQPTEEGRRAAEEMTRDQHLWNRYRARFPEEAVALSDWSLAPIGEVLPADLVAELERDAGLAR